MDLTADKSGILLGCLTGKADQNEWGFKSGGNTAGGIATMMPLPLSAVTGTSAPTAASVTWTKTFSPYEAIKSVKPLAGGDIAALFWQDGAGPRPKQAGMVRLSSTGTVVWGPTDYGVVHGEGSDFVPSLDASSLYLVGLSSLGATGANTLGRLSKIDAATGVRTWSKPYGTQVGRMSQQPRLRDPVTPLARSCNPFLSWLAHTCVHRYRYQIASVITTHPWPVTGGRCWKRSPGHDLHQERMLGREYSCRRAVFGARVWHRHQKLRG